MDVLVKHNGSNITNRVVSYEREHRICTGIGTLQIVLSEASAGSFDPWDEIEIHENGDFKVTYFISDVSRSVPENTVTLECQDMSKKLVDFFIPETYTIDYPSYTRTWIELFLTQAGIDFDFLTASPGNLLSNYTQLGLAPAYDQIMMLLQMSGWYMYFDGDGVAVIGTLDKDLSSVGGSVGKTDILNIQRITDDKMLRNRAVVWGQFDPIRQEYAYADVSKHTPWNYDHDDLRTMVISNNNIPNLSSAYSIANILLKEFSKVTVEKHISLHGARNFTLGDVIRVNSGIWRGKGMITTFSVVLDRNGLLTNIILDERCPRLFGFFNFGDYVYVGTFGDGVWRKHIKFDPTWYNFSTGLTNLNITDLHINNGVFGSVGQSGEMFISQSEEGPWFQVSVSSLDSSADDDTVSGIITYESFSGIMARATIVDKETNNVKFGVDTASGTLNTGDYFLTYSGIMALSSGIISSGVVVESGNERGWILEYDPFTGALVGGLGSGIYPISYSGNYNLTVLDLENDGRNDYVSVRIGAQPVIAGDSTLPEYNYGTHPDYDNNALVSLSTLEDNPTQLSLQSTSSNVRFYGHHVTDNVGEHNVVIVYRDTSLSTSRVRYTRYQANLAGFSQLSSQIISIANLEAGEESSSSPVVKLGLNHYKMFVISDYTLGESDFATQLELHKRDWTFTVPGLTEVNSIYYVDPPIDMDFSTPPFPFELQINVLPFFFDKFMILVWNWAYQFLGIRYYNKIWYQRFDYTSESLDDAILVFEVEDLSAFDTDSAGVKLAEYGDTFQSIGIYTDRDITDPTKIFAMYGTGFNLFIGSELFEGESYGQKGLYKLSDMVSAECLDPSDGSTYINYGLQGIQVVDNADNPFAVDASQSVLDIQPIKDYPGLVFCKDFGAAPSDVKLLKSSASPFLQEWEEVNLGNHYALSLPATRSDSVTGRLYLFIKEKTTNQEYLATLDSTGTTITSQIEFDIPLSSLKPSNVGNFIFVPSTAGTFSTGYWTTFVRNLYPDLGSAEGYLILQREGSDFNLIQRAAKPLRIDISNTSPVLSAQDFDDTFVSNFVYNDEVTQISTISGNMRDIRDYRYALMETMSGMVVNSGFPVSTQLLYVNESGIYTSDVNSYSGGFVLWDSIPSGNAERIETSNYTYPGQFIFITTSGENPMFYQKDNDGFVFDSYSGLPDSRATIIRLDDRI